MSTSMYREPGLVLIGSGDVGLNFLNQLSSISHRYGGIVVADTKHVVAGLTSKEELSRVIHAKRNGGLQSLDMRLDRTENLLNYFLPGGIMINAMPTVFSSNGSENSDIPQSVSYDIEALRRGTHVIVAHKSAFGSPALYELVRQAASESGARYLPAGVFMGPTRTAELLKWLKDNGVSVISARGIVNGTTNNMLYDMSRGISYEAALKEQVRLRNAEKGNEKKTDGQDDVQGLDALTKIRVPAIIFDNYREGELFGLGDGRSGLPINLRKRFADKGHLGIEGITAELLQELKSSGQTIKLIGSYDGTTGNATVGPVALALSNQLSQVSGTENMLALSLDGRVDVLEMLFSVYGREVSIQSGQDGLIRYSITTDYHTLGTPGASTEKFEIKIIYNPNTNQLVIRGPGAGTSQTAAGLLGAAERIRRKLSNEARIRESKALATALQDQM